MNWLEKHRDRFELAQQACEQRHCWSAFPEMPGKYPDAEAAQASGMARHHAQLGQAFALDQPGKIGELGQEISPYTPFAIGETVRILSNWGVFSYAYSSITCCKMYFTKEK